MKLNDWSDIASIVSSLLFGVGSTLVSIIVFYRVSRPEKKYELENSYRRQILDWCFESSMLLIRMRLHIEEKEQRPPIEDLAHLSALIDLGRFYFPNISTGRGQYKPHAFQGIRDVIIDLLVWSYQVCYFNPLKKYTSHLITLQRYFISEVFFRLGKNDFLKSVEKFTGLKLRDGVSLGQFLSVAPETDSLERFFGENIIHW